ncbi:MAG: corrinoid protein [Abditibacteriales bacterium]|nr:corrinoid protein [Abditibacteriales bacterium]MDW8366513.1 corrinoid protein [Abditibacteriales bacterium]
MPDWNALAQAIIEGQRDKAVALTQAALREGCTAKEVLDNGLVPGMSVVGEKFKANEFYIPEVLLAARAMKSAMEILRPLLAASNVEPRGRAIAGTVRGDLHDIGKNLVVMMLEGAGFQVTDLGVDCSPDKFVEAAQQHRAKLVCLSALLTTTMPAMKDTIEAFKNAGLRDAVKIMVGGAPLTQQYADSIGADGYAPDAASAVDKAKELLGA